MKGRSPIARRLNEARLRAGFSQKKLGVLIGIDEFSASPRINQYERGKHTPNFETVERLAKTLGVPTPYFYCVDDDLAEWIMSYSKTTRRARSAPRSGAGRKD